MATNHGNQAKSVAPRLDLHRERFRADRSAFWSPKVGGELNLSAPSDTAQGRREKSQGSVLFYYLVSSVVEDFVLLQNACESANQTAEFRPPFNARVQYNALYCEGVPVADGCRVAIGVGRASDVVDEGREQS